MSLQPAVSGNGDSPTRRCSRSAVPRGKALPRARQILAVTIAVAVIAACGGAGNGIGRGGSRVLARREPFPSRPEPTAYRIVYRVEDRGGRTGSRIAQIVRPFQGRQEIRHGARLQQLLRSDFARSATTDDGGSQVSLAVPPSPAVGDVRTGAVAEAAANGRLVMREQREILSRRCQVYRSATALGLPLRPVSPTARDWTDVCLDADHLALEVVTVAAGRLIHREVATSVELTPPPSGSSSFAVSDPLLGLSQGGGVVRRVDPASSPPGLFYEATPPPGFTLTGRFAVIPPQPTSFSSQDPTRQASREGSVDDVFVDGADMITVERGGTLGGVSPYEDEPGSLAVDLAPIGPAEEIFSLGASQVRARTGDGHFVRVVGTVAPSVLLDVARSLRPVTGTALRFLDPLPAQK